MTLTLNNAMYQLFDVLLCTPELQHLSCAKNTEKDSFTYRITFTVRVTTDAVDSGKENEM